MIIEQLELELSNFYKEENQIKKSLTKCKENIKQIKWKINNIKRKDKEDLHDKKVGYTQNDVFNANKEIYDILTKEQIQLVIEKSIQLSKNIICCSTKQVDYNIFNTLEELKNDFEFAKKLIFIHFTKGEIIKTITNSKKPNFNWINVSKMIRNRNNTTFTILEKQLNDKLNSRDGGYKNIMKSLNELRQINKPL